MGFQRKGRCYDLACEVNRQLTVLSYIESNWGGLLWFFAAGVPDAFATRAQREEALMAALQADLPRGKAGLLCDHDYFCRAGHLHLAALPIPLSLPAPLQEFLAQGDQGEMEAKIGLEYVCFRP